MKITFKFWLKGVDSYMGVKYGVTSDTIPDMPWYDWFKESLSVNEAAEKAIKEVEKGDWL
jgi:hypothetical protein